MIFHNNHEITISGGVNAQPKRRLKAFANHQE